MKKNLLYIALFAGATLLASCESDRDSNPMLETPTTFTLNQPALAGGTYDLGNATSIVLTCQQPAYGFTAPATYEVQVSLDKAFPKDGIEVLPTTYTTARMDIDANELAVATTNLMLADGKTETDFPLNTSIYVRLKSSLRSGVGEVYSNPIALKVHTTFALPPVQLPEKLYMIGTFCDWNWDNAVSMIPVNSHPELFWRMVYLPEGGLKLNTQTNWNDVIGYAQATVTDNNEAGVSGDGEGNISISKAGWYLVVVKATIEGRDTKYSISFNRPNVYLFGAAAKEGGQWEANDDYLFTVPNSADGDFVSPSLLATSGVGDDCVRACVKLDGVEWWQSEFMVFDGKLEYRGIGGDQSRVGSQAGQKLYINFTKGTGAIK